MIAASIVAVAVIIALIEAPALWRSRSWKELWTFSVYLLLGTVLSVAQALHKPIPNPFDWIMYMFKPASEAINRLLS